MKKRTFYTEAAYAAGLVLIAAGVVLAEKADFGVSMIVAPAYLLYRWLSPVWNAFTFGIAEYCMQAFLIVLLSVITRRFKKSYLFCAVTVVLYGLILDGLMLLGALLPDAFIWQRVIYFAAGMLITAAGVSLMFHTYISPEAYELFVKECSDRFGFDINRFKIAYDCTSCVIGLLMSFAIFGMWKFVGVSWGTVVCALLNGVLIGRFSALFERIWEFKDALPLRRYFEQ